MPAKGVTGCRASGRAPSRVAGQDVEPVPAADVDDQRPGASAPVAASPETRPASASSGTASSSEVGAGRDLVGGQQRHARQRQRGAATEASETRGGGDDAVAGARERGAEHGADPAGTDDADGEAGGSGRAQAGQVPQVAVPVLGGVPVGATRM